MDNGISRGAPAGPGTPSCETNSDLYFRTVITWDLLVLKVWCSWLEPLKIVVHCESLSCVDSLYSAFDFL